MAGKLHETHGEPPCPNYTVMSLCLCALLSPLTPFLDCYLFLHIVLVTAQFQGVTGLGSTEAKPSQPAAPQSVSPAVEQEDSLVGLSPTERKALSDLESMLFGKSDGKAAKK